MIGVGWNKRGGISFGCVPRERRRIPTANQFRVDEPIYTRERARVGSAPQKPRARARVAVALHPQFTNTRD